MSMYMYICICVHLYCVESHFVAVYFSVLQLPCGTVAVCTDESLNADHESQCVAVCCSVLQCVAVCCSFSVLQLQCVNASHVTQIMSHNMLQGVAGCCRVLQGVAGCCRVLQGVAGCCSCSVLKLQCMKASHATQMMRHSVLQCVAVCCSVLQLQCVAVAVCEGETRDADCVSQCVVGC